MQIWSLSNEKNPTRFNKEKEKFKVSLWLQSSENMFFQEIHFGVNKLLKQYSHLPSLLYQA